MYIFWSRINKEYIFLNRMNTQMMTTVSVFMIIERVNKCSYKVLPQLYTIYILYIFLNRINKKI